MTAGWGVGSFPILGTGEVTTQARTWECHKHNEGGEESDKWGEAERARTAQCGEEKAQEHLICMCKYLMKVKEKETDLFSQWRTVPGLETVGPNWNTGYCFRTFWNTSAVKVNAQDGQRVFVCMLKIHLDPLLSHQLTQPVLNGSGGKKFLCWKKAFGGLFGVVWSSSDYQSSTEKPVPIFTEEILVVTQTPSGWRQKFLCHTKFSWVVSSGLLPVHLWTSVEYF